MTDPDAATVTMTAEGGTRACPATMRAMASSRSRGSPRHGSIREGQEARAVVGKAARMVAARIVVARVVAARVVAARMVAARMVAAVAAVDGGPSGTAPGAALMPRRVARLGRCIRSSHSRTESPRGRSQARRPLQEVTARVAAMWAVRQGAVVRQGGLAAGRVAWASWAAPAVAMVEGGTSKYYL
eukprot:7260894-Prymnesium_polylepis.1